VLELKLYEERVTSRWITLILAIPTLIFLFLLGYQLIVGPLGSRPAPNWFFLIMFLLFLALTINFSALNIKITDRFVSIGYGIIKYNIPWENIKDCYLDETSSFAYGGWGIRIGKVEGKSRLIYNVIGGPRVVIALRRGKFDEFVFSTRNPQVVIEIVKSKIR